jgi:hypothetical protein
VNQGSHANPNESSRIKVRMQILTSRIKVSLQIKVCMQIVISRVKSNLFVKVGLADEDLRVSKVGLMVTI